MTDLFRETVFGRTVNLLSGGKIFAQEEQLDPSLIQRYTLPKDSSSSPASSTNRNIDDKEVETAKAKEDANQKKCARLLKGTDHDVCASLENGKDCQLVAWSENDPHNPRNWSYGKKIFVTFQICLLTTSVYIGSAIYTAGIPDIIEKFHVSEVKALLGLTLFVLGYALGPMVWAPMSEIPYIGRNPVYVGTLFAFVFLQFAVIYAKNFNMVLAFRFLTGLVGSPVLATGGATIADIYKPAKQAYGIGIWGIAAVFGPALGPLIGGFAAENKGWTWTIWELLWLSAFCLVFLFFLPDISEFRDL